MNKILLSFISSLILFIIFSGGVLIIARALNFDYEMMMIGALTFHMVRQWIGE